MNNIEQRVLVNAVIIDNKKVLMQKRMDKSPDIDSKWTTPGGVVEINEHPEEAIVRELEEELGIKCKILSLIPSINSFPNHKDKYHFVYISFECEIISGTPKNIDQEEDISEIAWIKIDDLDKFDILRGTLPPIEKLLEISE